VRTTSHPAGSAVSADGTTIGYRQLGRGPGIIVVHGSMSSGYYHLQLAEALAGAFTLYLLDRRGRGLSGPYRSGDGIRQEAEDLDAVLAATGAHNVFAVSVGADIALRAASRSATIGKLALYEPLLFPDQATGKAVMARFNRQLAAGKTSAALATAMKGAQLLKNALRRVQEALPSAQRVELPGLNHSSS
jgi:pimeloyl-ACP methyl ester carboxylesterase